MRKALMLSLATILATLPLAAAELSGVRMDDTVKVGDDTLVLNGLGLRKKSIIKVYVGGLYLPAKESDDAKIFAADAPRRMVMHFLYRKASAEKLAGGWDDCLEANNPAASGEVKEGFRQLNGWMEEVVSGDRLVFTYTPGSGTEAVVKGASKGRIAGKPFADALFACWIGAKPATGALKEGLLGQ